MANAKVSGSMERSGIESTPPICYYLKHVLTIFLILKLIYLLYRMLISLVRLHFTLMLSSSCHHSLSFPRLFLCHNSKLNIPSYYFYSFMISAMDGLGFQPASVKRLHLMSSAQYITCEESESNNNTEINSFG